MNKQQWRLTVLATIAIVIVFLMQQRKHEPPASAPATSPSVIAPIETVSALFARRPIPRGMRFESATQIVDYVELHKNVPKDLMPVAPILSRHIQLKDMVVLEDIAPGEPLSRLRFAYPEEVGRVISSDEPLR